MEISPMEAREILTDNNIELSIDEPRTVQQYVTELMVYIEAIEQEEYRLLINTRHISAQSVSPYFA